MRYSTLMKSVAAAAALVLLVSTGARAQNRYAQPQPPGSIVMPPTLSTGGVTILPPPPSSTTPFTARPETYSPRYNDPPRHRGVPYFPGALGLSAYAPTAVPPAPE